MQYRVMLVVWQMGWVEIDLGYYTSCWAVGVMAEWADWWNLKINIINCQTTSITLYCF